MKVNIKQFWQSVIYFFQDDFGMPGLRMKAPFVTVVEEIVVRPTTDVLDPIESITKDGIKNTFNDVQFFIHV